MHPMVTSTRPSKCATHGHFYSGKTNYEWLDPQPRYVGSLKQVQL